MASNPVVGFSDAFIDACFIEASIVILAICPDKELLLDMPDICIEFLAGGETPLFPPPPPPRTPVSYPPGDPGEEEPVDPGEPGGDVV